MLKQTTQTPENDDKEYAVRPVPAWIKQGGMALLAIVVLFVLWLVFSHDEQKNRVNLASLEAPSEKMKTKQDTTGASSLRQQPGSIEPAAESTDAATFHDRERFSPIRRTGDIQPMKQELSQLQQQLQQMDARFTRDQERQDGWVQAVQKLVDEMRGEIAAMKKSMQHPKPAAVRKVKRKAAAYRSHKNPQAPFTLVSIDRWGSDLYAVIRYQGRLHDLTVGQSLGGWSLESFSRRQDRIILKNAQGRTLNLSKK